MSIRAVSESEVRKGRKDEKYNFGIFSGWVKESSPTA